MLVIEGITVAVVLSRDGASVTTISQYTDAGLLKHSSYPWNALPGMCAFVRLDKYSIELARQKEVQPKIMILIRL